MCQTENVISPPLARAAIGALAATAWLIFSIGVPESLLNGVCGHAVNAKIVIRAWPTCGERAYCGDKSRRWGGAELELSQDEPRGRPLIAFKSMAYEHRPGRAALGRRPTQITMCAGV
jgi:hypothetical protein